MNILKDLNSKQIEGVSTSSKNVKIIAGAGSGKTRVLTHRIAYLISEKQVAPWNILAITFTNKVANEMKARLSSMIPECQKYLTIKTFHSFAAMFLRQEIASIDFPANFTILDEEDQTKLVKDIASSMNYKKSDKIVTRALSYIGSMKLKEKYPDDIHIVHPNFPEEKECLEIYTRYEEEKNKMYCLDFDDLLLKTNFILEHFPNTKLKWRNRISHILIDEFQDTNDIEYKLICHLSSPDTSLYVVGDPDQTIYTWRGANQKIIMEVDKDYPGMETIILDRNYRSTQKILDSANKLIANNKYRVPKDLYTENKGGEDIVLHCGASIKMEADYVAKEIQKLIKIGYSYSDIAILYRANYVSKDFETAITVRGIPYKIYGGTKFYQRKEIKDVLAYFHLIVNVKDDISFKRIFNVPRRGIGETSELLLEQEAAMNNMSIYEYICSDLSNDSNAPSKAIKSLKTMIARIDITREDLKKNEEVFSKTLENLIVDLGYVDYLLKEDDGEDRQENVKALFEDIRHFLKSNPEATFDEYLQNIALISAQDELVDGSYVTLMTAHTAKGLEYPVVFVVRLNNGVFPHNRSLIEGGYQAMEEERRLAYVAFTRAKERLYLTFANDYSYVVGGNLTPSQFLKESGNNYVADNTPNFYGGKKQESFHFSFDDGKNTLFESQEPIRQDFSQEVNEVDEWNVGDFLIHEKFGKGVVVGLEGDGIITVEFDEHGRKSLMGNHPFIKKGGN